MQHTISAEEEARLTGARAESLNAHKAALADRDRELGRHYETIGPGSVEWRDLDNKHSAANDKVTQMFARLRRNTDAVRIPWWLAVIAAIGLAALEAPINKFMLDNILRGSNFDSYVVSLFLTLILLWLAHIAGTQTRQIYGGYQEKIYATNIVVPLVILVVLAFCIGALTIGRAFYTTTGPSLPGNEIFSEIGRRVQTVGIWTAFVAALSDQAAFFLATMNSAGVAGAFLFAYITHDSDKVYQGTLDEAGSLNKRLLRMAKRYSRIVDKIDRRFRPLLTNVAAAYALQNGRVVGSKRARDVPLAPEDNIDLSQFDEVLQSIRAEITARRPKLSKTTATGMASAATASAVSENPSAGPKLVSTT